jgi:hypothetical protein
MTVADLLTRALFDLKVYGAGQVLTPDDAQLGLDTLNDWIDALATEGLTVFTVTRVTWAIVSGTPSYTIGVGATINAIRPVNANVIPNIGFQDSTTTPPYERLLGSPLTEDDYAAIPFKTLQAVYPNAFYYNPRFGSTGFGLISLFPIPTSSSLTGVIYVPSPVAEFAAITDTVSLPPGYRRFFRTNLAIEMAAAFDAQIPPQLLGAAIESKGNVKRINERLADLSPGPLAQPFLRGGVSNIYTGDA